MDENLKNIILELTSSQLVVNWLELCGFETLEDLEKINENVLIDIENYIGSVCSLMPLDKREKYIEVNVFQSYPMQFKLPPNLKIRLLSASQTIAKRMNKFHKKTPLLSKFLFGLLETNCNRCAQSTHDFVSESIKKKFIISKEDSLSFHLFQPKVPIDTVKYGYFCCSIINDESSDPCGCIEKFSFIDNTNKESINLSTILSHMDLHFAANSQQRASGGRVSTDNVGIRSIDHLLSDNRAVQPSPAVDPADAQLCNDLVHTEIAKLAESKFVDCRLERDVDFNVYEMFDGESGELTNRGCFLCYLCVRTKSIESKIKFFFTSSRSVVNSNIIAHLRRHFQSVAPSSTSGTPVAFNTPVVMAITGPEEPVEKPRKSTSVKRASKRKLPPIDVHVVRTSRVTRASATDIDASRSEALIKTEVEFDEKENNV